VVGAATPERPNPSLLRGPHALTAALVSWHPHPDHYFDRLVHLTAPKLPNRLKDPMKPTNNPNAPTQAKTASPDLSNLGVRRVACKGALMAQTAFKAYGAKP
jgi:hypothetical protein